MRALRETHLHLEESSARARFFVPCHIMIVPRTPRIDRPALWDKSTRDAPLLPLGVPKGDRLLRAVGVCGLLTIALRGICDRRFGAGVGQPRLFADRVLPVVVVG